MSENRVSDGIFMILEQIMALIRTQSMVFELQSGETLLEGLERTGHHSEFQCRSGYCGSCRVKILQGRVAYERMPLAFLMPDEILPCCCSVLEDISIDCSIPENPQLLPKNSG